MLDRKSHSQKMASVLCLYQYKWDKWIDSPYCFLTNKEIAAIEYYVQNYYYGSEAVNASEERYRTYRKAIKSLGYYHKVYRQWIDKCVLKKHDQTTDDDIIEFLDLPLQSLDISTRLYVRMLRFGKTMREVLKECNSKKKFLNYRDFGRKTLTELEELLKQHNCSHLLKEK